MIDILTRIDRLILRFAPYASSPAAKKILEELQSLKGEIQQLQTQKNEAERKLREYEAQAPDLQDTDKGGPGV
jgi:predicted  nucleic acid-binding Zn-ribbon protein